MAKGMVRVWYSSCVVCGAKGVTLRNIVGSDAKICNYCRKVLITDGEKKAKDGSGTFVLKDNYIGFIPTEPVVKEESPDA